MLNKSTILITSSYFLLTNSLVIFDTDKIMCPGRNEHVNFNTISGSHFDQGTRSPLW